VTEAAVLIPSPMETSSDGVFSDDIGVVTAVLLGLVAIYAVWSRRRR